MRVVPLPSIFAGGSGTFKTTFAGAGTIVADRLEIGCYTWLDMHDAVGIPHAVPSRPDRSSISSVRCAPGTDDYVRFAVSILCYAFAFARFRLVAVSLGVPRDWAGDFTLLLGLSAVLAGLQVVFRQPHVRGGLLLFRMALVILTGYPHGAYLGVEAAMLTPVLLEVAYARLLSLPWRVGIALAVIAGTIAVQGDARVWGRMTDGPGFDSLIGLTAYYALVTVVGCLLRGLVDSNAEQRQRIAQLESSIHQLSSANVGFQQYASTVERTSILEERNRVSREIHDTIGHSLTTLMMMMEASHDLVKVDPESAQQLLSRASGQVQDALWQTRSAVRALRLVGSFELSGLRGIKRMVDAFANATGVSIVTDYGNLAWSFNPPHDATVVALIQEGLTNAFRHGRATSIRLMFWRTDLDLRVSIIDNGTGSVVIEEGIGLLGMHERFAAIGGRFEARSLSPGFALTAWVPLE